MTATTPTGVSGPELTRDERSVEFYDAAGRGELLIRRCTDCGHRLVPEARTCSACGGQALEWVAATGAGELVSWVLVHKPPLPAFADQVPFTVGIVELAEGPWLQIRVVPGEEDLAAGMPVQVAFVAPEQGEAYPVFVPA